MKKTEDLIGHPLWIFPVFLLVFFSFIQTLHTMAHLHQEIDVHGICRQNKEYIQMREYEE